MWPGVARLWIVDLGLSSGYRQRGALDTPLNDALMLAAILLLVVVVVMLKIAELAPAGTLTFAGTLAFVGLLPRVPNSFWPPLM